MGSLLSACATSTPTNRQNICALFEEKSGWYKDAKKRRINGSPACRLLCPSCIKSPHLWPKRGLRARKFSGLFPARAHRTPTDTPARITPGIGIKIKPASLALGVMILPTRRILLLGITFNPIKWRVLFKMMPLICIWPTTKGRAATNAAPTKAKNWLLNTAKTVAARTANYDAQLKTAKGTGA